MPHYRVVVAEARSRRQGAPVATLGYWNPGTKEKVVDKKLYADWIKNGALPTEAVKKLFV
jgi:small subunit ribosomal protein S16